MTGLGVPDSTADDSSAGGGFLWSADCASISSLSHLFQRPDRQRAYITRRNTGRSFVLNANRLPPCVASSSANVPTVTVGGVAGTVIYGGWVEGTVARLYQLNVTLPGSGAGPFTNSAGQAVSTITAPVLLPVVVTANSQTARQVSISGSRHAFSSLAVRRWSYRNSWHRVGRSNNAVTATEGTSPYRYAVTSGLLPSGLSLNVNTGAITGTPAANTPGSYTLTVTGTDRTFG